MGIVIFRRFFSCGLYNLTLVLRNREIQALPLHNKSIQVDHRRCLIM